jgi:DNA-binding GntR family transcriptional regulator
MPPDSQISRSPLSDQVKDRLLQEILSGEYPPGSRIVETRVARELGTSQAPVREALRDLEALGVVEISAFRGARVRHPSKAELLEAYGIRAELESLGARLALPRMSDADLEELQGYVEEMQRAADVGDTHTEAVVDVAFHARIIQISNNHTLERVWRHLEPLSRTYITLVVPGVNRRHIADLHVPILAALRSGDPDLADAAYHLHFEAAGDMFRETWVDDPSTSDQAVPTGVDAPPGEGARRARRLTAVDAIAQMKRPRHGRAMAARNR